MGRQGVHTSLRDGSIPSAATNLLADLAQLGEHFLDVERVRGSSPLVGTIVILGVYAIMVVGYAVNVVAWVRFPLDPPLS